MIYRCPATSTTPDIKKLSVHIAFGRSGEKVTRLLIVKKSKKKKKRKRERSVTNILFCYEMHMLALPWLWLIVFWQSTQLVVYAKWRSASAILLNFSLTSLREADTQTHTHTQTHIAGGRHPTQGSWASELTACDHAVIMSRFLIKSHFGGSASTTETFYFSIWNFIARRTNDKQLQMKGGGGERYSGPWKSKHNISDDQRKHDISQSTIFNEATFNEKNTFMFRKTRWHFTKDNNSQKVTTIEIPLFSGVLFSGHRSWEIRLQRKQSKQTTERTSRPSAAVLPAGFVRWGKWRRAACKTESLHR